MCAIPWREIFLPLRHELPEYPYSNEAPERLSRSNSERRVNVYNRFEKLQGKLMLGCRAHARRKFTEALEENHTLASEALVYIGKLYQIER